MHKLNMREHMGHAHYPGTTRRQDQLSSRRARGGTHGRVFGGGDVVLAGDRRPTARARRGSGEAQLAGLVLEVHGPEKARDGAPSASGGKRGGRLLGLGGQPLRGGACVARSWGGEGVPGTAAAASAAGRANICRALQHRRCKVNIGRHLPPSRALDLGRGQGPWRPAALCLGPKRGWATFQGQAFQGDLNLGRARGGRLPCYKQPPPPRPSPSARQERRSRAPATPPARVRRRGGGLSSAGRK